MIGDADVPKQSVKIAAVAEEVAYVAVAFGTVQVFVDGGVLMVVPTWPPASSTKEMFFNCAEPAVLAIEPPARVIVKSIYLIFTASPAAYTSNFARVTPD